MIHGNSNIILQMSLCIYALYRMSHTPRPFSSLFHQTITFCSSTHLEAPCYIIFAKFFLPPSSHNKSFHPFPLNNKHGGAAAQFTTLSTGLNKTYRSHNAACTVRSIDFLNYRCRFILKIIELICELINYNSTSAEFCKML